MRFRRTAVLKPALVVRLQGGLGNQLFQYCAALGLGRRWGMDMSCHPRGAVGIAVSEVLGNAVPEADEATLDVVGRLGRRETSGSGPLACRIRSVRRSLRRRYGLRSGSIVNLTQAASEAFEPQRFSAPGRKVAGVYLDGYFQHPSFFGDTREEVAGALARHVSQLSDVGLTAGRAVIAFRRGDYVQLGWCLPMSYYESALSSLDKDLQSAWVIGDDPLFTELAVMWLRAQGVDASMPPDLGVPPVLRDLRLLIAADAVIMANSTFCWWGVTAGDQLPGRRRRIIAPSPWLPFDTADELVRPEWERVDATRSTQ